MRVAEIFSSFQGEGRNQGLRCTFLRLAGCNLNCRWCDTPAARDPGAGSELTGDEILQTIREIGNSYLCITGGEPLLQAEELLPLLEEFSRLGYMTDIETNGTIPVDSVTPFASITLDVKCPSSGETSDTSLLAGLRAEDSVKFVVQNLADLEYAHDIIRSHPTEAEIFISPVAGSDYQAIAEELLSWDHRIRLQLQLHKQIGVR
ncbi:MAG: 4Fe-4S cluster-binding domain-containing protein [Methanocalculus sp. MSAO_Arc1]|uniref:7-carboxy-7-deazaguanine synthase QueE n=1 Tax=Methanocalculus TaxID=71151 RepID=UPI000FED5DB3|nr:MULTISPECIES: radical SAM protein [unclassified Methanocalculus]MCP1662663.1 7-carboxy-7-deazaguanine synthase [Methanocalculus sp. AMF5]RQD80306.1 MAG: 4Fe-4S cluster-binding domain-containing protein [Methanocalculus sp. MSAO_Arc1]